MYGLGYDVVSDRWLLFLMVIPIVNLGMTLVSIFTLSERVFIRNLRILLMIIHALTLLLGFWLVNWLACRISACSTAIAAFDLSVDKFSEIPGPIDLGDNFFRCILATLKGCLCMSTIVPGDRDTITVWIMKEYGVKESWTKFKITEPTLDVVYGALLCSITDDDDVLLDISGELVVYNMKENQHKDLLIDIFPIRPEARTFVDSLVSMYFGNEIEG